ncbi:MAG: GNAT family N-acetyltransferase [Chloroflexota bacterium]
MSLKLADSPIGSPSWILSAIEAFSVGDRVITLVAGSNQEPEGCVAFVRRPDPERFEPAGAAELYEPIGWPFRDDETLRQLAVACTSLPAPLFIPRIHAESPVVDAIRRAFAGRGIALIHPVDGCLWVELDQSWTEPERHLNSDHRRNLMRRRRRASELGSVAYEVITPSPEDVTSLLDEALRIEATGWKGDAGSALLTDDQRGRFFRAYAERAAREGVLRICFLSIGEEHVAMQIGVEWNDTFWALKMGYDERFARFSPGRLLALEALRDAAQRGLERFEMLGAAEPWKLEWGPQLHPCVAIRAYPATIRSAFTLAADAMGWSWRRILRQMRARELTEPVKTHVAANSAAS